MADFLSAYAAAQPDKLAVVDDRPDGTLVQWSFAEFDDRVGRLANVLADRGAGPGVKVVWCGRNSPGVLTAVHAIRRIGAVSVPLNYRLSDEEAAYVTDHSDATIVVVDAEFADLFVRVAPLVPDVADVLVFDGPVPAGMADADALIAAASPERRAEPEGNPAGSTMTYTSGTTGKPKGALRRVAADPAYLLGLVATLGYTGDDVYLTTGPLYHSGPGGFTTIAQALGQTVVVQRHFEPEDWLRLVERHRVTSTFSAPTPIRMVCALPAEVKARYDVSSMQKMVANAAPWSMALKHLYLADFPADSLWEVYGSTELGVNCVLRPEDQLRKPGSCGQPVPGVEVKLFDDGGVEVTGTGPEHPGELFVRSTSVFDDYYKQTDKFEADTRGEFHTVGDIAYRDDEGYLYICDRKKDMVITGGMNVYPAEVEGVLEQHPDVFDVAVFGIPSEEWGEAVHAVVVLRPGAAASADELVAFARQHLAGYKSPRSLSFLDELPRTGSGKLLKRELRAPYWAGRASQVG